MFLTDKRKQEATWSLHFSRHIEDYKGRYSYTSFMRYCRINGRPPSRKEVRQ